MKKTLAILAIGLLTSCDLVKNEIEEAERLRETQESLNKDGYVQDEHGQRYRIVMIEGCEFYLYDHYRQMGLTKVDCNCVADTSKR